MTTHSEYDVPFTAEGNACHDYPIAENLCEVVSNEWVNTEYKHLVVKASPTALSALPGQFFHLSCLPSGTDTPYLRRPMSLYRVNPVEAQIEFLYKVQGAGTRGLATLETGGVLDALGPLGIGFSLPAECRHVLILARGVGLATMAPLAEYAIKNKAAVTAILSARSQAVVMSADYLRSVGASVIVVTDEDRTSAVTHVEKVIRETHALQPFDLLATCGSNRFLLTLQKLGKEFCVQAQVALEQHMGCGLGMCYACVRPFRKNPAAEATTYRRVCWDGPVFDVQEAVAW